MCTHAHTHTHTHTAKTVMNIAPCRIDILFQPVLADVIIFVFTSVELLSKGFSALNGTSWSNKGQWIVSFPFCSAIKIRFLLSWPCGFLQDTNAMWCFSLEERRRLRIWISTGTHVELDVCRSVQVQCIIVNYSSSSTFSQVWQSAVVVK